MAETAALLADEVFPDVPLRQWLISFPFPLRYLFAAHPQAMGKVLGIVYRAISTHLTHKAGFQLKQAATGAVTPARPVSYSASGALSTSIRTRPDRGLRPLRRIGQNYCRSVEPLY
jgi:hypothetical protein